MKKERKRILYRLACFWWEQQETYRHRHPKRRKGREEGREVLCRIFGAAGGNDKYRAYQIQKRERLLAVFFVGMGTALVLGAAGMMEGRQRILSLERPESGSGSKSYALDVQAGEEQLHGIEITVPEQRLTQKEANLLLEEGENELFAGFLEQGTDPDRVREDLLLPTQACSGMVDVRWESSDYDLMDGSGRIRKALVSEEGETVILTAGLSCGGQERQVFFPLRICPRGEDTASRLARQAQRGIREEETRTGAESIVLPREFEGRPLLWQRPKAAWGRKLVLLTLAGCVLLHLAFERDLRQEGEKRKEALLAAYPAFLSRLTLLAGTGTPLRLVFWRLAQEGTRPDAEPVYEEVLRTVREMESGVTQLQAYENFGRRTHLPQYKKCASLLAQNVRKGSSDLLTALGQEAENAFEERKAMARKKGEEAQTRLLLPMLMMLAVVMILIMVPACFSFGG